MERRGATDADVAVTLSDFVTVSNDSDACTIMSLLASRAASDALTSTLLAALTDTSCADSSMSLPATVSTLEADA
eukprot:SAG22_NODE_17221_length_309_cov_0.866667_1_plen_74_part_10